MSKRDRKEYMRQWYEEHAGAKKEHDKKYYQTHKEEKKESSRAYRAAHAEELREKQKKWYAENRTSRAAYAKKWRADHKEEVAHTKRRIAYGITPEEYSRLLESQGGVCALCGGESLTRGLAVDHNHETGEVRGLLCGSCNTALGLLKEDVELLFKAIKYLDPTKIVYPM